MNPKCTSTVSLDAIRSTGMMKRKKNTESMANPFAVRVWDILARVDHPICRKRRPYNDTVIPGKDSQLIQSRDQVPTCSNIAGDEYSKSENREGVHELEPSTVLSPDRALKCQSLELSGVDAGVVILTRLTGGW